MNRRAFLAAICAAPVAAKAALTSPGPMFVARVRMAEEGLFAIVDDGPVLHEYNGFQRDAFEGWYRHRSTLEVCRPSRSSRLDGIIGQPLTEK